LGTSPNNCQFPVHYYSYHQRKQNCADEEGAAIPGTAKAPAATSPHNNNHLHNTLLLQLQMLLLFSVRLHVRLSVRLCLSPEFKGGSFSAHKLTLQQTQNGKNKKQKKRVQEKHNNNNTSNNRSKTRGLFKLQILQ
jgi:hypothetical protein